MRTGARYSCLVRPALVYDLRCRLPKIKVNDRGYCHDGIGSADSIIQPDPLCKLFRPPRPPRVPRSDTSRITRYDKHSEDAAHRVPCAYRKRTDVFVSRDELSMGSVDGTPAPGEKSWTVGYARDTERRCHRAYLLRSKRSYVAIGDVQRPRSRKLIRLWISRSLIVMSSSPTFPKGNPMRSGCPPAVLPFLLRPYAKKGGRDSRPTKWFRLPQPIPARKATVGSPGVFAETLTILDVPRDFPCLPGAKFGVPLQVRRPRSKMASRILGRSNLKWCSRGRSTKYFAGKSAGPHKII